MKLSLIRQGYGLLKQDVHKQFSNIYNKPNICILDLLRSYSSLGLKDALPSQVICETASDLTERKLSLHELKALFKISISLNEFPECLSLSLKLKDAGYDLSTSEFNDFLQQANLKIRKDPSLLKVKRGRYSSTDDNNKRYLNHKRKYKEEILHFIMDRIRRNLKIDEVGWNFIWNFLKKENMKTLLNSFFVAILKTNYPQYASLALDHKDLNLLLNYKLKEEHFLNVKINATLLNSVIHLVGIHSTKLGYKRFDELNKILMIMNGLSIRKDKDTFIALLLAADYLFKKDSDLIIIIKSLVEEVELDQVRDNLSIYHNLFHVLIHRDLNELANEYFLKVVKSGEMAIQTLNYSIQIQTSLGKLPSQIIDHYRFYKQKFYLIPNIVTLNLLIYPCIKLGNMNLADSLVEDFKSNFGIMPNIITYHYLVQGHLNNHDVELAESTLKCYLDRQDLSKSCLPFEAILKYYLLHDRIADFKDTWKLLSLFKCRLSWSIFYTILNAVSLNKVDKEIAWESWRLSLSEDHLGCVDKKLLEKLIRIEKNNDTSLDIEKFLILIDNDLNAMKFNLKEKIKIRKWVEYAFNN